MVSRFFTICTEVLSIVIGFDLYVVSSFLVDGVLLFIVFLMLVCGVGEVIVG